MGWISHERRLKALEWETVCFLKGIEILDFFYSRIINDIIFPFIYFFSDVVFYCEFQEVLDMAVRYTTGTWIMMTEAEVKEKAWEVVKQKWQKPSTLHLKEPVDLSDLQEVEYATQAIIIRALGMGE